MQGILDHFSEVSMFDRSLIALVVILAADWIFSAAHAYEEWRCESAPLWRVMGAVVGLWLPNWLGFLLFTLLLTLVLWSAGLVAVAGWLPFVGDVPVVLTIFALGFVIGARISDTLVSHWGLYAFGYRPNPGIKTTPLYLIEAIVLIVTFRKGLSLSVPAALWGCACGAGLFIAVLPMLRAWRAVAPSWQRSPWIRGEALPIWARR